MAKNIITCKECDFKSTCFQQLSDDELSLTNESKVQVGYKKGETILKQGSFVTHILYIKEGVVKVYRENEDDSYTIFNILSEGSLIGLSSLFYSETNDYSIAALTGSKICAIDRKVIQQIIKDNSGFSIAVIESLNKEIAQLKEKMISLTLKQLQGRLSDSILHLANEVFESERFQLNLSRKDLADFSGMSTMSVVRTLQHFMKNDIIREDHGEFTIIDRASLEKMAAI